MMVCQMDLSPVYITQTSHAKLGGAQQLLLQLHGFSQGHAHCLKYSLGLAVGL